MAEAANYTVVQDGDVTLPDPATNDSFHLYPTFGAPGLSTSTSLGDRPVLHLKVNPGEDDAALEVTLNNTVVYTQTFSAGKIRSVSEVLAHGNLLASGNIMIISNSGEGAFTVSDILVDYKTNV
jgi:hypothetical protein